MLRFYVDSLHVYSPGTPGYCRSEPREMSPVQYTILKLDIPLALRISAVLMLGVVRVHSRQVGYLFTDASDAVLKFQK
eukprot:5658417-Pyramimonas_sp.AAC.1